MGPSKLEQDLQTLSRAVSTTEHLTRVLQTPPSTNTSSSEGTFPHPNPLAVLNDACKILKAQTTKLSLLLLNTPYTPSEITHILTALNNGCLPALATTLDLCFGNKYTGFLRRYINLSLTSIWVELRALVGSIPTSKEAIERLGKEGTLQSTGVLWETCDNLIHLAAAGTLSGASRAVKDSQALLQDAIDELDEWDPDDDDDDEDEEDSDDVREPRNIIPTPTTSDDERLAEGIQNLSLNPLIAVKAMALKHLRLVRLLYPALDKHRIKTFPSITSSTDEGDLPLTANIQLFDQIITATKSFTEEADEIAAALYSEEIEEVERRVGLLASKARDCIRCSRIGYDGKEDGFSEWADKWINRSEELSK